MEMIKWRKAALGVRVATIDGVPVSYYMGRDGDGTAYSRGKGVEVAFTDDHDRAARAVVAAVKVMRGP